MKKAISIIICLMFLSGCSASCYFTDHENSKRQRAVHLAKNSYALASHFKMKEILNGGDAYWTNEDYINHMIQVFVKGPVYIDDWKAIKYNEQTYIVTYMFKSVNTTSSCKVAFDVNLKGEIVRFILTEQYESYGL